jgi:hypothetical protein
MFFVFNLEPIWEAGILPLNYSRLLALSAISVFGQQTDSTSSPQNISQPEHEEVCMANSCSCRLGGHPKTGHMWPPQNRPYDGRLKPDQ